MALARPSVYAKHVLFVLECLSDVIYAKGSILSLWALDPPVFLLLAQNGRLLEKEFCHYQPLLHFTILKMLKTHCSCHHQFLASSQLLVSLEIRILLNHLIFHIDYLSYLQTTNQTTLTSMAPTAKYFQILIQTITEIIKLNLNDAAKGLMLDWIHDVLKSTSKSFTELVHAQEFDSFVETIFDIYGLGENLLKSSFYLKKL